MLTGGARVDKGLGNDGQTRLHGGRLGHVEHELGVLDEVHPEPEREAVGLPGVGDVGLGQPVGARRLVQEVEQPLDGGRQGVVGTQDRPEEVVHELLNGAFGGEQPRQEDLRDRLVRPVGGAVALRRKGGDRVLFCLAHQMEVSEPGAGGGLVPAAPWVSVLRGRVQRGDAVRVRVVPRACPKRKLSLIKTFMKCFQSENTIWKCRCPQR